MVKRERERERERERDKMGDQGAGYQMDILNVGMRLMEAQASFFPLSPHSAIGVWYTASLVLESSIFCEHCLFMFVHLPKCQEF